MTTQKINSNEKYMLKPWGFAPVAGRKQTGEDDNGELSYAERVYRCMHGKKL